MLLKRSCIISILLLGTYAVSIKAQVPTVQDCLGAIPICQNVYSTTTSYFGMGNYPNEVSLNNCLYLGGESNSVWYVFTVQTSGVFRFILTPNSSGDDYDWAVFNLTNYGCLNIYSTPSMMVSCNASGYTGATGISTPMGGSGNSNGPNWTNKFNQDLPVQAGETYVLMISNWSNGTPGYTIDFSSSTAQIFDNIPPHIHQITSNVNCGATSLTFQFSENILCSTLSTCDLSLTGPGGPYTITSISGNGCNVGGKQEKTFTINFTPPITTGGTFYLNLNANVCGSVTDLCGNTAPSGSLPFTVNIVNATVSTTVAACATPNGTATATATGGSGNYTYIWNTTPPQTTATAINLYPGTYTVTVYDGACSSVATGIVGTTSNMAATTNVVNATCNLPNGSATVNVTGGTLPLLYQWNTTPPQTTATATNLYPGTYTVTITDVNSCTQTATAVVKQLAPPPSASISGTNILCFGNNTGSANLTVTGGTPPFTYLWSNGSTTQNLSNVVAGNYSVTVTDAVNCSTTANITILQPSAPLVATITPINVSCYGNSDGSASASVTGGTSPYNYNWSNGASTSTIQNLSAGIYYLTITDNNGCSITQNVNINQPTPLSINLSTVNVSCYGGNDASASIIVNGGIPPYNYVWLPSGTAGNVSSVNSLVAGTYTVIVSDQHNCNIDTTFLISEPPKLMASYLSNDVSCFGGNNGSITISASGGSFPYAYIWSPNISTAATVNNVTAGSYTVTVTDHNGCDTVLQILINEPAPLILTTTGNDTTCIGQQVSFGAIATGGVPPYLFTWNNNLGNSDNFTITASSTITYNVIVTDSNNCQAGPDSLTIYVSPPLTLNLNASPIQICQGASANISVIVNGGQPPYSYTWNDNSLTGPIVNVMPNTTSNYSVTVTDFCGSPPVTSSVTITVYPLPDINFFAIPESGCAPLLVNFNANSTSTIQSWHWNFDDPLSGNLNISLQQSSSHVFANPGNYSITISVVDLNGCQNSYTNNIINVYPNPIALFSAKPNPVSTVNPTVTFYDQSINASTWLWNFGDNGSLNNVSSIPNPSHTYPGPGNYTVWLIVNNEYGCIDSATTNITVNQDFAFWVPSAFTPNEDGINDIFVPKGININPNSYKMIIFDRWGKEIFATNDINYGWNGMVQWSKEYAPQGVYVWKIIFEETNGTPHSYIGRVTLIK